jgi:hypothetical protein
LRIADGQAPKDSFQIRLIVYLLFESLALLRHHQAWEMGKTRECIATYNLEEFYRLP